MICQRSEDKCFHNHQIDIFPGCHTTELLLSCPPGQLLVIQSAAFQPSSDGSALNCSGNTLHSSPWLTRGGGGHFRSGTRGGGVHFRSGTRGTRDIRRHVTSRCSGYSRGEECKFSMLLDVVDGDMLGPGMVSILHSCVDSRNILTQCQPRNKVSSFMISITINL